MNLTRWTGVGARRLVPSLKWKCQINPCSSCETKLAEVESLRLAGRLVPWIAFSLWKLILLLPSSPPLSPPLPPSPSSSLSHKTTLSKTTLGLGFLSLNFPATWKKIFSLLAFDISASHGFFLLIYLDYCFYSISFNLFSYSLPFFLPFSTLYF